MMNIKTLYPSKWLSADDLGTRRVEVVIAGCTVEDIRTGKGNETEPRLVVAFEKATKRLICNKTQSFQIADVVGSCETDEWPGHKIAMHVGRARNGKPTIVVERAAVQPPAANLETGE